MFKHPLRAGIRFLQNTTKDLYYFLLKVSWMHFVLFLICNYVALNLCFALIFLKIGGIASLHPAGFWHYFFFSIQTMSTVGYGAMHPVTMLANLVVTIEIIIGLFVTALFTGLMFAKFSRPQSKVIFSKNILVSMRNHKKYLVFRLANERDNTLSQVHIRVSVLRSEETQEGDNIRKSHDLTLERSSTPLFSLTWTVLHPIDENSPLHGLQDTDFEKENIWIAVSFTGHDPILSQTIHRHHIYKPEDLRLGYSFKESDKGTLSVEFEHFDAIQKQEQVEITHLN